MSLLYNSDNLYGLIGGALIGASAGTLLLLNGDIMGASGIVRGAVLNWKDAAASNWKYPFLASFCVTSNLYTKFIGFGGDNSNASSTSSSSLLLIRDLNVSNLGWIASGFLVGFGTAMGNGCTTGHGICGLARRSVRSLAAVLTFMITGIATSSLLSNADSSIVSSSLFSTETPWEPDFTTKKIGCAITALFVMKSIWTKVSSSSMRQQDNYIAIDNNKDTYGDEKKDDDYHQRPPSTTTKEEEEEANGGDNKKWIGAVLSGSLFSIGLAVSGMAEGINVKTFLDVTGLQTNNTSWNPRLMFVMGGGMIVSMICYDFVPNYNMLCSCAKRNELQRPLLATSSENNDNKFNVPTNTTIDVKLIAGAAFFGVGWGIGNLCPGPAMFLAATGYPNASLLWWPAFLVGSYVASTCFQIPTNLLNWYIIVVSSR